MGQSRVPEAACTICAFKLALGFETLPETLELPASRLLLITVTVSSEQSNWVYMNSEHELYAACR